MIKLTRVSAPTQLTIELKNLLTNRFITTKESVWNIEWLKESLLSVSHSKCCYCECSLSEESKYMEVEHFEDKSHYPSKVMDWNNLLPACKRCNGSKSSHDVLKEPIINPFEHKPSDHLSFRLFNFKGTTTMGKTSIEVLNLNDLERAVNKRFKVGLELERSIQSIMERLELYRDDKIVRKRNRLTTMVTGILNECQPKSIYSATCATILHSSDDFAKVKEEMVGFGIWSSEMEELFKKSNEIRLKHA